jgi:hypothetical protein
MSGVIDTGDFTIWRTIIGKLVPNVSASGAGASVELVPEPGAIMLVFSAIVSVCVWMLGEFRRYKRHAYFAKSNNPSTLLLMTTR